MLNFLFIIIYFIIKNKIFIIYGIFTKLRTLTIFLILTKNADDVSSSLICSYTSSGWVSFITKCKCGLVVSIELTNSIVLSSPSVFISNLPILALFGYQQK